MSLVYSHKILKICKQSKISQIQWTARGMWLAEQIPEFPLPKPRCGRNSWICGKNPFILLHLFRVTDPQFHQCWARNLVENRHPPQIMLMRHLAKYLFEMKKNYFIIFFFFSESVPVAGLKSEIDCLFENCVPFWWKKKLMTYEKKIITYRISSYSCRGYYSFLNS